MTVRRSGSKRQQGPAEAPDPAPPSADGAAASKPVGEVVEIRVHGVHGTSPQSMLGLRRDEVRQVAGDGLTGVFRARPGVDLPRRHLDGTKVSVEAYSWGALTSGVRGVLGWLKRALWLLLLPFALANLSYWARLRLHENTGTARWGARASRLGALLLTVFMVLTPCLVGIDLVGWQCYRGDSPGCHLPGALDFMAGLTAEERLVLGSLVPLGVLGLLWMLSHTTLARYEACTGEPMPAYHQDVLRHPRLWRGATRTRQLQQVHLGVGLAVVIGFSGVHVLAVADTTPAIIVVTVTAAAAIATVAIAWSMVMQPDDIDYFPDHTSPIIRLRRRLPRRLKDALRTKVPFWTLTAMLTATVVHLGALLTVDTGLDVSRDFVGHNLWFIGVFVALTAVHLSVFTGGRMPPVVAVAVVVMVFVVAALAVAIHLNVPGLPHGRLSAVIALIVLAVVWSGLVVWHFAQRTAYADVAWNGAGASVVLAAAVWVALLFTTGVVTGAANYLNGPDHGVADLISSSDTTARAASLGAAATTRGSHGAGAGIDSFTATGDVTADHAIVTVDGGRIVVVAGSLRMTSLLEPPSQTELPSQRSLARALDSTRVDRALLLLPEPMLQIADSCVRNADLTHDDDPTAAQDLTCTAEDDDFVPAGALPVAGGSVLVLAQDSPVTLAVADRPARPLVVPQVLIWSPIIQLVWLVAVAGFAAVALLRFRRTAADLRKRLLDDDGIAERDRPAVRKARRSAALAHRAERLLDGVGSITAFLALALITLSATGKPPWDIWEWTRHIATLSMYVALGLGLCLLFVGSQLRTSESARKGVGVLWDLTTFWPRAAHPLAPPCYAERVVPELHTRLDWVLRANPDNVAVLSGHSQGSAILAAVVSRLPREDLARVRVITYGSQIRALYGRVFPQVLGHRAIGYCPTTSPPLLGDAFPDAGTREPPPPSYDAPAADGELLEETWAARSLFDRVFLAGGAWANLFRRTDPLGFRVFSDTEDAPDHWVPEVPAEACGDPGPTVLGHSGYQHSLVYRRIVAEWTGEPLVEEAEDTLSVPALPEP